MTIISAGAPPIVLVPIVLFNDECGVCRRIAHWVAASAAGASPAIVVRPIGEDPAALRALNPGLDIWAAYETVHVLMPDGAMKTGGEAVAEVLRDLPNTRWFAGIFRVALFGVRPFQVALDAAYAVLADTRPLLGCESCGKPSGWLRPIAWTIDRVKAMFAPETPKKPAPHFSPRPGVKNGAKKSTLGGMAAATPVATSTGVIGS